MCITLFSHDEIHIEISKTNNFYSHSTLVFILFKLNAHYPSNLTNLIMIDILFGPSQSSQFVFMSTNRPQKFFFEIIDLLLIQIRGNLDENMSPKENNKTCSQSFILFHFYRSYSRLFHFYQNYLKYVFYIKINL